MISRAAILAHLERTGNWTTSTRAIVLAEQVALGWLSDWEGGLDPRATWVRGEFRDSGKW